MDGNPKRGGENGDMCQIFRLAACFQCFAAVGMKAPSRPAPSEMANFTNAIFLRIAALRPWLLFQRIHMPPSIRDAIDNLLITFWNHCSAFTNASTNASIVKGLASAESGSQVL